VFNFKLFNFGKSNSNPKINKRDPWYYNAIVECADGLWDWEHNNSKLSFSAKLSELIGYQAEEMSKRPLSWWLEQVHPDDRTAVKTKIEELFLSKGEFLYFDPFRFLCKNGNFIWLENHAKVLRDRNAQLVRMSGVITNLTPQKFIQNQLQTIINEQEKEAQSKMRFLSALNHELRTPLSGIIGMVTLLKESNLSLEQQRFAENITNSIEMLLALVNDILDVSKLNSGKFEFEKIHFPLTQVVKRSTDLIRPTLVKKNLEFNIHISQGLPESFMGDPTRLQQILVNLLSNAAKFTSKGLITLNVKEGASLQSQNASSKYMLHFEVCDTGIGIAPEVQEQLFEDFIQANSSITRVYGGTGLGLSICKELVRLMGGQIGVKSELGKGSTFWFTVPLERPDIILSTETPAPPAQQINSKLNILLAEDNHINQEVMTGLLQVLGDNVTVVNNGEEAVELFKEKHFDIVLMDLNMPILDGLSATKVLRTLPNGQVPIIAVTANTLSGDKENCLNHGISHVLNKPITKESLEQALLPYRKSTSFKNEKKQEEYSQASSFSTIDQITLKTLINDLGEQKVIRLLDHYRNDALALVYQIKNSKDEDRKNYAHTLAGLSDNLGMRKVGKSARDIMGANQTDSDSIPILIEDLERNFLDALTEVQDFISSPDVPGSIVPQNKTSTQ